MSKDKEQEFASQRAKEILELSGNCAQSAFATLQEQFNLDGESILKALTPFPGLALRGEACGAVVGSLMALGLVYGRDDLSDKKGYVASLPSARRFCSQFEKKFGGTSCACVLETTMGKKFNLADREESNEYLSAGGQHKCGEVVANAVQFAATMIRRKIMQKPCFTTKAAVSEPLYLNWIQDETRKMQTWLENYPRALGRKEIKFINSVADFPINSHLGMEYDEDTKILSLPENERVMNHFGQVSFCAQFALAEASSAQFLTDELGLDLSSEMPTLRKTTTKFHKPTNGNSICNLVSLEHTRDEFQELLSKKSKILTNIEVEVVSENGTKSLSGSFQWLILKLSP